MRWSMCCPSWPSRLAADQVARRQHVAAGSYVVELACPRCGIGAEVLVEIVPRLVVDVGRGSLRARLVCKAIDHRCGQLRLTDAVDPDPDPVDPGPPDPGLFDQPAVPDRPRHPDFRELAAGA